MTTVKYYDEYIEAEITVEEMSRKEALEYACDFINGIEYSNKVGQTSDMSVYVEYNDGTYYHNIDGDITGSFKRKNIKAIILDDGYEYYIFGDYTMSEYFIPEVA